MYISIGAIALIVMFAIVWYNIKKENGEIFKRRNKPKKKLTKECLSFFTVSESLISSIANLRTYEKVLDLLEESLDKDYRQYLYNMQCNQDVFQEYYKDMFENQTDYKCYVWSIWFCKETVYNCSKILRKDAEKFLLKDLKEKFDKIIEDENCPESFLKAWEISI